MGFFAISSGYGRGSADYVPPSHSLSFEGEGQGEGEGVGQINNIGKCRRFSLTPTLSRWEREKRY